ncbi:MAG TPA: hypothetical protein PKD72_11835 [Gemmatales bacterium]|nr:hypothetical protein [Gemmatales bacterium]
MTWFIALSVCLVSVASIQAQQSVTGLVPGSLPTLAEGRFRKALDATATPVMMDGETAYRQPPLTLECWVKLSSARQINVIVSCDPRQSSQHWCLQSQSGTGKIELYLPGYSPQYISGDAVLADGKWHAAAFTFDGTRVKLFVDGALTA